MNSRVNINPDTSFDPAAEGVNILRPRLIYQQIDPEYRLAKFPDRKKNYIEYSAKLVKLFQDQGLVDKNQINLKIKENYTNYQNLYQIQKSRFDLLEAREKWINIRLKEEYLLSYYKSNLNYYSQQPFAEAPLDGSRPFRKNYVPKLPDIAFSYAFDSHVSRLPLTED